MIRSPRVLAGVAVAAAVAASLGGGVIGRATSPSAAPVIALPDVALENCELTSLHYVCDVVQPTEPTTTTVESTTTLPETTTTHDHTTTTTAPSTTTTAPATTTTRPPTTTTQPATTTTVRPTTTTTVRPTTTTTTPATTTTVPAGASFFEGFDGNSGLTNLNSGLYRRDNTLVAQTQWEADHNMACGSPDTHRTVHRSAGAAEVFFGCGPAGTVGNNPHLMISEGDASGYSIAWISPKRVFTSVRQVCMNVNLNFGTLGYRQWPSIAVMPVSHTELTANVPAADAGAGVTIYPPATGFAVADIGSPNGATGKLQINGKRLDYPEYDAGADAATRYPVCFTDNRDGTLTLKVTGPIRGGSGVTTTSFTQPGKFPSGNVKVVIAFHGYTPLKAGGETGVPVTRNTWHVDDITVLP